MIGPRDIPLLVQQPRAAAQRALATPIPRRRLILGTVLPWASVRAVASLAGALWTGTLLAGVALATSSFLLQLGTWLGLELMLPIITRQFGVPLSHRHSFLLSTLVMLPLWLAGALYVVPEEPPFALLLSRTAVALAALYGLFLLERAFALLEVPRQVRLPMIAAVAGTYAAIYMALWTVLGIVSHVLLFWLK